MQAALYQNRDPAGRERIDHVLYGPPTEDEWMADPAAIAEQERLMAMAGGPDAMGGQAP